MDKLWREIKGNKVHSTAVVNWDQLEIGTEVLSVDPKYYRPAEVETLLGDATKAKEVLGWEPKISFSQLVEDMCTNDN